VGDKITSHNQSGGITAGEVSASSIHSEVRPVASRYLLWKIVAGVIAAASGIAALFQYFGLTPWSP
jgi:hypothetical protein